MLALLVGLLCMKIVSDVLFVGWLTKEPEQREQESRASMRGGGVWVVVLLVVDFEETVAEEEN